MSRRSEPSFLTTPGGAGSARRLAVIATGCDATTEHECGIAPLLRRISGHGEPLRAEDYGRMKKAGQIEAYPNILDFRRVGLADSIRSATQHIRGEDVLVVGTYVLPNELHFGRNANLHAEWDDRNFLFAARIGSIEEELLRQFLELAKAGHLIIGQVPAEDIAPREHFSGIIFSDARMVSDEAKERVQREFEESCRVWEDSEIDEVRDRMRTLFPSDWSYVWPVRLKSGSIGYNINPGYAVRAALKKSGSSEYGVIGEKADFFAIMERAAQTAARAIS